MANTFTSSDNEAGSKPSSTAENQPASRVHETSTHPKEPSLKATFTAVLLLGGFIIISWVLVFLLRNSILQRLLGLADDHLYGFHLGCFLQALTVPFSNGR